jgi:hypothetical protein
MAGALEARGDFVVEAMSKLLTTRAVSAACKLSKAKPARTRSLPPAVTLWIVVLMAVFRRLSCENLLERVSSSPLLLARWKKPPSTTALTKARDRLGIEPLQQLFRETAAEWAESSSGFRISIGGRRLYAMDGVTVKVPDTPANRAYFGLPGQSRGRTGYPQFKGVTLLDLGPRQVIAERHGPYRTAEITLARKLLSDIPLGSVLVLDRGFLAYDFLWSVKERSCDFIVRAKKNLRHRVIKEKSPGDRTVEVEIPLDRRRTNRRKKRDKNGKKNRRRNRRLPKTWRLREVTFRPVGQTRDITVWTTILSPEVPAIDIAAGYCARWEIETVHDELKTHLAACTTVNRPVLFRSETPERIEQEWYGLLLAYNAIRRIMCEAAAEAEVQPQRLSFTGALERVREAIHDMARLQTALLPSRYRQLLRSIGRTIVPDRTGRRNPRVVKIKMSKFLVKQCVAA